MKSRSMCDISQNNLCFISVHSVEVFEEKDEKLAKNCISFSKMAFVLPVWQKKILFLTM